MRVLLVSDFLPPVRGGLEFHVSALASALADHGDEVFLATLTSAPEIRDGRITVHTIRAASTVLLPHESADRPYHPPVPDPLARRELGKLIAAIRPDIIHAHNWLGVSLPRSRPPLVFTAHDYGLICQLRTLVRPDRSTCSGPALAKCIACGAHRYPPAVSALLAPGTVAGRALLRPDAVVAVSAAVRDALAPHLRTRPVVIHNFVPDEPELSPLPDDLLPGDRYAMFAGHAGADKGMADLLGIWAAAPELGRLFIATTRPADVATTDRVTVASLDHGQVGTAWRGAAMALVPSRWPDPCPTVVLEAMQAGVPVVGYAVGGIPELVRDGVDGVLVPVGDREALRNAIATLFADEPKCRRLGESARQRAHGFTATPVVAQLRQVYERLIRERVSSTAG